MSLIKTSNSNNVAAESTVKTVDITDWQTRFGPMKKTVTQLVTPKVVVCNSYESNVVYYRINYIYRRLEDVILIVILWRVFS